KARWKTGDAPDNSQWKNFAVRNHRFRLVGRENLYDMLTDPEQTTNVIDRHPDVARAMVAAYQKFWAETRPLMVNESAPMSPVRPFHALHEKQKSTTGIPAWVPPAL
ncbi:MAG: hypothetical protein P8J87_01060, partial [Verrucomicrobiales bacterium]|nr:hypothetical protein [Verrucomicrobiales bacterium]